MEALLGVHRLLERDARVGLGEELLQGEVLDDHRESGRRDDVGVPELLSGGGVDVLRVGGEDGAFAFQESKDRLGVYTKCAKIGRRWFQIDTAFPAEEETNPPAPWINAAGAHPTAHSAAHPTVDIDLENRCAAAVDTDGDVDGTDHSAAQAARRRSAGAGAQ